MTPAETKQTIDPKTLKRTTRKLACACIQTDRCTDEEVQTKVHAR